VGPQDKDDRQQRVVRDHPHAELGIRWFGDPTLDLYPASLRGEIDEINRFVYDNVNNGVYRAGLAKSQEAYEQAFRNLFTAFDELETRLSRQRWLVGDRFTEADLRLFPTLVRFDTVYYVLFKCNLRRLADYHNLSNYTREIYQMPGVAATVDFHKIKLGYYGGMRHLNPRGIVPLGPALDFSRPHDRSRLAAG
jgi:glutathionyl-hydroquinone reductase